MPADVTIRFLGSGDAFCSSGRHQASYLVQGSSGSCLMDCGATILAAMKRDGLSPGVIDTVLISHLHGDHFGGLPFLLLEYTYEQPRRRPLRIAGPPGTAERLWTLYRTLYPSTAAQKLIFDLEITELSPGSPAAFGEFVVEPFPVPHQENELSLGMVVRTEGRRILYSGDTGWTDELVRRSEDTDLFICECTYFETRLPIHLDYPMIRENLDRFGTRRLILTHLGSEVLARRGEVEPALASDGLVVSL